MHCGFVKSFADSKALSPQYPVCKRGSAGDLFRTKRQGIDNSSRAPTPTNRAGLPATRPRLTFERPEHLPSDPTTIETAGLRLHSLPADVAFDLGRVEARITLDRHELGIRLPIAPPNVGDLGPVGAERPIAGVTLPFAMRGAPTPDQEFDAHITWWNVEGRRARRLEDAYGASRLGNDYRPVNYAYEATSRIKAWWTWIVPNGFFTWSGVDGPRWTGRTPVTPLSSRALEVMGVTLC